MVCLPLPTLHPLNSERPFFSMATKGKGSDFTSTFTGPLCFQMVLFSCDTVDTQHLPRIWTLLWGSIEGRWVVCGCEGTGMKRWSWGGYEGRKEEETLGVRVRVRVSFMGIWIQLQHHLSHCLQVAFHAFSSLHSFLSWPLLMQCSLAPVPYFSLLCPLH